MKILYTLVLGHEFYIYIHASIHVHTHIYKCTHTQKCAYLYIPVYTEKFKVLPKYSHLSSLEIFKTQVDKAT